MNEGRTAMAKILIIDDEDQYRSTLKKMLEKAGYNEIEEAANGSAGLKIFQRHHFDLVITDIIMPEKEGIETIVELLRIDPRIKIIAMSGGGRIGPENYLELARHLGAGKTLAKPFKQAELLQLVQETIHESERERIKTQE